MMIEKAHTRRLSVICIGGILFWILLVGRLVYIQLERGSIFQSIAKKQQLRLSGLKPDRGLLYDRRGIPLSMNLVCDSFGAQPDSIQDRKDVASRLAPVLGVSRNQLLQRLQAPRDFVWLAKDVDPHIGARVRALHLPGILPERGILRYYPFGVLGGQVIGFTNSDNEGIEGIEMGVDPFLKGIQGKCIVLMDANCRQYTDVTLPYDPPQDGCDVVLTLDARCQSIVEDELRVAVQRFKAIGAMGLVMIPQTGEVIAMANIPEFNPNCVSQYKKAHRKNRVVTDTFEPGSIFKMVTAAAALQEGIAQPEDSIYAENGAFSYGGIVLHDWKKFGWVTFRQAIEHSVNIAVAKIALQLGPSTFYEYATNFGFGCKTGIRFPGEVEGVLRDPARWSRRSLMTMALGQEVSVTALQMACAFGAVANGGRLMQPQIVKMVVDKTGRVVERMEVRRVRNVLLPETARKVTEFLTGVVDHGTGVKAQVDHITVAGKTGTAQKAGPHGYIDDTFVASFVGFLPAEDPRLVGIVVIDEPQGVQWGGEVAAPIFGRMMTRIIHLPGGPLEECVYAQAERLDTDVTVPVPQEAWPGSRGVGELLSHVLNHD